MQPNRKQINDGLRKLGLGGNDDPNLMNQLAAIIRNHVQFRRLLTTVEPDKRKACYDALRGKLWFEPKPLDVYLAEAGEIAERRQLPSYNPATAEVTEYKPAEVGKRKLAAKIEETLARTVIEDEAKTKRGRLTVHCRKCLAETTVFCDNRQEGYMALAALDWKLEGDKAVCPDCNV